MKNNLTVAHKSEGEIQQKAETALYEVLKELPKPAANFKLSASQKKWWYYFGNEFVTTKQFSKLDLVHLQKAAFWMDARCQAFKEITTLGYKGLVQKFPSGATNITGHVSIVEKADKHLDEVSAHFGLSIKDRQRLKTAESNEDQLSLFETVALKLSKVN
jgi:hypothetical protein